MALLRFASIAAAFNARFPEKQQSGKVDSLAASGTVPKIDAAGLRPFSQVSGPLKIVKATESFRVGGSVIPEGELVEVEETEAKRLKRLNKAVDATDAEITAARAPGKK